MAFGSSAEHEQLSMEKMPLNFQSMSMSTNLNWLRKKRLEERQDEARHTLRHRSCDPQNVGRVVTRCHLPSRAEKGSQQAGPSGLTLNFFPSSVFERQRRPTQLSGGRRRRHALDGQRCQRRKDSIWDDLPQKAQWQATNVDGQNRKVTSVTSTEPRRVREGAEDALWDEVAGAKVSSDVVTNVNEVPEAHKKHMADSEKEKGNEAFYSKDYQEAEAYYSRSLQYMADDPSTWANRALVRLKLDQAQDALEDCEHALALNGSHVKALHRKGKALYELQRYKDAVRAFQEALLLSPGNSQINGDLMVARRKLRDDEAAPCTEQNGKGPKQLVDAPSIAAVPLQAGYTRVQIEEDSDSEEEEKPANAEKKGGSGGFQKIAIEEVSGSEDEEVPGRFNPPPRVAPPVTAGGFDAMD
ncbi:unnamed protein product [Cladocopium goreaui]|uniref:Uncharacterized protein n=1 Tax=Cladocopium goreaui TaxID=2562237 RepID=A0A9P1G9C9_9DINO|nr:unnamed protein product [Cladocopium goreaui]